VAQAACLLLSLIIIVFVSYRNVAIAINMDINKEISERFHFLLQNAQRAMMTVLLKICIDDGYAYMH
jgi:hypothetical protein